MSDIPASGSGEPNGKKGKRPPIKTVYYNNELTDEFSSAVITPKKIDGDYRYDRDRIGGRLLHFFFYRIVAIPTAFFYLHLSHHHKIIGSEKIKAFIADAKLKERKLRRELKAAQRRQRKAEKAEKAEKAKKAEIAEKAKKAEKPSISPRSCFIYGNHTQATADALIPTFITHPANAYVIVHPNNVSMPVLGRITPYIGALPLPDDIAASRNFRAVIDKRIREGSPIFIYPEAHIWPYYTGIRPFPDDSFYYPIKYNVPVFCFTNTYKRHGSGKPRIVTYVDGPFYPNEELPLKDRRRDLRDRVYDCMKRRSLESDVVWIEYLRADTAASDEN